MREAWPMACNVQASAGRACGRWAWAPLAASMCRTTRGHAALPRDSTAGGAHTGFDATGQRFRHDRGRQRRARCRGTSSTFNPGPGLSASTMKGSTAPTIRLPSTRPGTVPVSPRTAIARVTPISHGTGSRSLMLSIAHSLRSRSRNWSPTGQSPASVHATRPARPAAHETEQPSTRGSLPDRTPARRMSACQSRGLGPDRQSTRSGFYAHPSRA
jgi:hypothetical protein